MAWLVQQNPLFHMSKVLRLLVNVHLLVSHICFRILRSSATDLVKHVNMLICVNLVPTAILL